MPGSTSLGARDARSRSHGICRGFQLALSQNIYVYFPIDGNFEIMNNHEQSRKLVITFQFK
jgi:hypothetical protein